MFIYNAEGKCEDSAKQQNIISPKKHQKTKQKKDMDSYIRKRLFVEIILQDINIYTLHTKHNKYKQRKKVKNHNKLLQINKSVYFFLQKTLVTQAKRSISKSCQKEKPKYSRD